MVTSYDFRRMAHNVLRVEYFANTGDLFDWNEINLIFEKHLDKSQYNLSLIWAILTFQVWAKQYSITR